MPLNASVAFLHFEWKHDAVVAIMTTLEIKINNAQDFWLINKDNNDAAITWTTSKQRE